MSIEREIAGLRHIQAFHQAPAPPLPSAEVAFWSWGAEQRMNGSWRIGKGHGLGFCLDDLVRFHGQQNRYFQGMVNPSNLRRVKRSPKTMDLGIFIIVEGPLTVHPVNPDEVPRVPDRYTHMLVQEQCLTQP